MPSMLTYQLPLRPQEMTVPQLEKFRNYTLGVMTPEEEEKFYNELAEDKKRRELNEEKKNRKRVRDTPLLDEEEMEIFKASKVFEQDQVPKQQQPLGKEMDVDDDFLKELDYENEGGKRRNKTHKGGRRHKRRTTKKYQKKSKTHKQKMHKKHRTYGRRRV